MTDAELTLCVTRWCEEEPSKKEAQEQYDIGAMPRWKFWQATVANGYVLSINPRYDFATDLSAWPAVHELLVERGQADDYLDALFKVTKVRYSSNPMDYVKATLLATPQQRSEALARMIGASDG